MKINQIVYDRENKEYVMISNGIPNLDEAGKEKVNDIKPTEAIALRVCILGEVDNKPRIAFTYRQVKADFLEELPNEQPAKVWFNGYMNSNPTNKHFNFLGRI
jgi:hypothetical protein